MGNCSSRCHSHLKLGLKINTGSNADVITACHKTLLLARDDKIRMAISENKTLIKALSNAVRSNENIIVRELASAALMTVSVNLDCAENMLLQHQDLLSDLVSTLSSDTEVRVREFACGTIRNLSAAASNRIYFVRHDALFDQFISVLNSPTSSSMLCEHVCVTLTNLAYEDSHTELLATKAELLEAIVEGCLRRKHFDLPAVNEWGCAVLRNLTMNSSKSRVAVIHTSGLLDAVLSVIESENSQKAAVEDVFFTLANLANEPLVAFEMVQSSCRFVDVLANAIQNGSHFIRMHACLVLYNLTFQGEACEWLKKHESVQLCKILKPFVNGSDWTSLIVNVTIANMVDRENSMKDESGQLLLTPSGIRQIVTTVQAAVEDKELCGTFWNVHTVRALFCLSFNSRYVLVLGQLRVVTILCQIIDKFSKHMEKSLSTISQNTSCSSIETACEDISISAPSTMFDLNAACHATMTLLNIFLEFKQGRSDRRSGTLLVPIGNLIGTDGTLEDLFSKLHTCILVYTSASHVSADIFHHHHHDATQYKILCQVIEHILHLLQPTEGQLLLTQRRRSIEQSAAVLSMDLLLYPKKNPYIFQ